MIDSSTHTMVPLTEAARHIPGRPHIATLHRWRLHGVRGRVLATTMIGGRRWTSLEAIREFLADAEQQAQPSATEQDRRAREAGRALERLGA